MPTARSRPHANPRPISFASSHLPCYFRALMRVLAATSRHSEQQMKDIGGFHTTGSFCVAPAGSRHVLSVAILCASSNMTFHSTDSLATSSTLHTRDISIRLQRNRTCRRSAAETDWMHSALKFGLHVKYGRPSGWVYQDALQKMHQTHCTQFLTYFHVLSLAIWPEFHPESVSALAYWAGGDSE